MNLLILTDWSQILFPTLQKFRNFSFVLIVHPSNESKSLNVNILNILIGAIYFDFV